MRQLPQSTEAEHGVLATMLLSPSSVIPLMLESLTAFDFYGCSGKDLSPNGTLFSLFVEEHNAGRPVDIITLTNLLRDRKQLDSVGGSAFITHLFNFTPTVANASHYRQIVREKADLRATIKECEAIAAAAYEASEQTELDERIHALASQRSKAQSSGSKVQSMQSLVLPALDRLEARHNGEKEVRGIGSGFPALDRKTFGWHPGQMIVLGAPEKQGKSSLARQLIEHAAIKEKVPCAIFTYEMSAEEIVEATLLSVARVDGADINDRQASEQDFINLTDAANKLSAAPIYIFDESHSTIAQYRANLRRAVQEFGVKLAMVDYLQLLSGDGDEKSREREVASISRATKQMAKELHIPIIILCQLNKDGDTRESMAIQQDCDKLIIISHKDPENEHGGEAFFNIKRSRSGPKGSIPVVWQPHWTRFESTAFESKPKPKEYAKGTIPFPYENEP